MGITQKFSMFSKQAQIVMALLTVVAGFYMMWGSLSGQKQNGSTLAKAAREAVEIDPQNPTTKTIGRLVVAAGTLRSDGVVEDDFIFSKDILILRRKVQMYQWVERVKEPGDAAPQYRLEWVEGQVDFFSFGEPKGHENPVLKYESSIQRVPHSTFGAFSGDKILDAITVLPEHPVTESQLKDPSMLLLDGAIYISREPGTKRPSLGDMKITYHALKAGDYTIAARQVDEIGLVGKDVSDEIIIKPGILSIEELFADVATESRSTFSGLMLFGALVFFIGLFSTIVRIAPKLDLRPKVELQGPVAVLAVSFGVTLVTLIVFSILSMVS